MSKIAVEHDRQEKHVRHVRAALAGREHQPGLGNGNRILRSWIRCLNDYGLAPDHAAEPVMVGAADLQRRTERLGPLQQVALLEMANLYQQLAGSGYAIMLTDADGVLLHFFGDPAFTHAASRSGLLQGALWSEAAQGTNGMGTCLAERSPVIVHQNEHYLVRNIGLSCAAAPIFDHHGTLVAVLDASGVSRLGQQHTLALVCMSVQLIENRVFLQQFGDRHLLRFHHRPEFVGTLSEGAIALDADGTVLAATRNGLAMLGAASPQALAGRRIGDLFDVSFAGLLEASMKQAFHPVPLFAPGSGARFFGLLYPPELPSARPPAGTGADRGPGPGRRGVGALAGRTPLDELVYGDPVMASNIQTAKRVMERQVAIVLYGETGTGKERFAKGVHLSGTRAGRPFVAINCAAIPEALIESELFGYKSGAFTGASKEGQRGKIFQAHGGTLFLDEIGDMPLSLQARLLRVLEEREVVALGSDTPLKLDIRLISATHCDLQQMIAAGTFREDLFYRLQGVTLTLPPLRERSDRHQLIRHVLAKESGDEPVDIDAALWAVFDRHPWPGNIRQLRQLLRTMIALRDGDVLTVNDLPPGFDNGPGMAAPAGPGHASGSPGGGDSTGPSRGAGAGLNPLEHAERSALCQQLRQHHWNISTLARQLDMSRNTLYRKMRRLGITAPDKAGAVGEGA